MGVVYAQGERWSNLLLLARRGSILRYAGLLPAILLLNCSNAYGNMKLQMSSLSSLVGLVQAGKIIIEEGLFPLGVCLFELMNPCLGACLVSAPYASLPRCASQLVCLCGGQGTAC